MDLTDVEVFLNESVRGIKLCLEEKLINSALVLLYCGIDTASSLDQTFDGRNVQSRYTGWCDIYLLNQATFDFTALELYSARCGVIHENSVQSTLSIKGKVRKLIYAWGNSRADTLREMTRLAQMSEYVAVQFEELIEAYEKGIAAFSKSLHGTEERRSFALEKMAFCLRTQPREVTENLLEWGKSILRHP